VYRGLERVNLAWDAIAFYTPNDRTTTLDTKLLWSKFKLSDVDPYIYMLRHIEFKIIPVRRHSNEDEFPSFLGAVKRFLEETWNTSCIDHRRNSTGLDTPDSIFKGF
jgi:hypothetical protein